MESVFVTPQESIAWVARFVLGVTFLVSGSSKVRDLRALAFGILGYEVLPKRWAWTLAHPLARVLAAAELASAVLLLTGIAPRAAAVGCLLLVAIFAYAVGINLHRGRDIPCMCITNSPHERIGRMTLARLAVLGVGAAFVARFGPATGSFAPPGGTYAGATAWFAGQRHDGPVQTLGGTASEPGLIS